MEMLFNIRHLFIVIVDEFVKSPSAALRCILRHCGVLISTPHSSGFARLAYGAFYELVRCRDFYKVVIVVFIISSCTMPAQRSPYAAGYVERGIASWYGEDFHGKPTSSGEIYNMYDLTAAHKLMPLGTVAKITNLETDQSVVVKINDRGPFIEGRIIDLSYSAAREIGMAEKGLSKVEIKVIKWGESLTDFTIQVGSFEVEENAMKLKAKLNHKYKDVHIKTYEAKDKQYYRVRVGSTKDIRKAERLAEKLSEEGFSFFITRKD